MCLVHDFCDFLGPHVLVGLFLQYLVLLTSGPVLDLKSALSFRPCDHLDIPSFLEASISYSLKALYMDLCCQLYLCAYVCVCVCTLAHNQCYLAVQLGRLLTAN